MFLTGRGTLASCPFQEETSDKRVPVVATGLVHLQASWPLSTLSGQDVSLSEKNPTRVAICCRKEDAFQGLKLGSCLTLGNELSEETYVLTKQEILLGKGTQVESSRVREPRRTALLHGSQSGILW